MAKRRVRETTSRGRETMEKLISVTAKELDRVGLAKVDIDSLLRKSKISRGSLYHHFGSKAGLLSAAEAHQYIDLLTSSIVIFRELVENCESKLDFATLMSTIVALSGSQDNRELRQKRIRAIAMSYTDKRLAAQIKESQITMTETFAHSLQIAKDKGWIISSVNVSIASFWLQAVFIGRVVLDITEIDNLDAQWNEFVNSTLQTFLVAD